MKRLLSAVMLLSLTLLSGTLSAQSLKRVTLDYCTINLPSDIRLIDQQSADGIIARNYTNAYNTFACTYCTFPLDKEFNTYDRLYGEAMQLGIDIDQTGCYGVTTSTSEQLLFTIGNIDSFSVIIGVFPHYNVGRGTYFCLADMNGNTQLLIEMISSFRLR